MFILSLFKTLFFSNISKVTQSSVRNQNICEFGISPEIADSSKLLQKIALKCLKWDR